MALGSVEADMEEENQAMSDETNDNRESGVEVEKQLLGNIGRQLILHAAKHAPWARRSQRQAQG